MLLSSIFLLYNRNEKLKNDIDFQTELFDGTRKNFLQHIFKSGFYIISDKVEIHDINANSVSIKNIVGNRPKIVFRMTDQACGKCINDFIQFINGFQADKQDDIIFLVSSRNPKYLSVLQETLSKSISLYRIDYAILENPFETFETTGTPYFFILTPEFRMEDFHIPDSNNLIISKEYLEEIKNYVLLK